MEQNDFKAFVFQEFAAIRREMAESARGAKLRKIDPDEESTNSGSGASLVSLSSASAAEEIFATPLSEQPASTRPLLESASALVKAQTWTRSTCQRYFAALRQHREEVPLQPARLETLSFLQLQELCRKLQLPPPVDFKSMPEAKAAVSKKCTGVTGYAVTRFLVEQTARSLAFLAEKDGVLGSGAVVQHVSRGVVTTAMVTAPVVFYDRQGDAAVISLNYRVLSLDDEGFGYAKSAAIQKVLVPAPAPPIPKLEMWQPSGDLARGFEENARQRKCFMKEGELHQLAGEVGVPTAGLKRDQIIDALSAWASTACLSHLEAQLCAEQARGAAAPAASDAAAEKAPRV